VIYLYMDRLAGRLNRLRGAGTARQQAEPVR